MNHDEEEVTITSINTYLAQALTDYNETTGRLSIAVYTGRNNSNSIRSETKRLDDEDFAEIANYSEDDFLMVTMADGVVQTIDTPEVVSDVYVSAYSSTPDDGANNDNNEDRLTRVTADGEDYRISAKAYYDPAYLYDYSDASQQLDGFTYDLLLDPYGYLLGIENVTDDENYFFVVGYEIGSSVLAKTIDQALVIFPDGTMQIVDAMEKDDTITVSTHDESNINAWYNYTVNSDGVYVISGLTDNQFHENRTVGDTGVIDSSHTTSAVTVVRDDSTTDPSYVYGNSDSVYIAVEKDTSVAATYGSIVDVRGVTTGIRNTSIEPEAAAGQFGMASVANVFGLYNNQGYVTYAVVIGDNGSVAENLIYLTSGITGSYYDSETQQYIYQYDAITNDSDEIVTVESTTRVDNTPGGTSQLRAHNLYIASYDSDGFIDEMELMTDDNDGSGGTYNTETYKDEGYGMYTIPVGNYTQPLRLSGAVLYLNANDNDQYVVLDEDCRFFVNGQDDDDGEYNLYPTAASALAALGKSHEISSTSSNIGKFVVIADPLTGFGTTVIFLDAVYEEDPVTGGGTPGTIDITYVLNIVNKDTGATISTRTYTQENVPGNSTYDLSFATVATAGYWGTLTPSSFNVYQDQSATYQVGTRDLVLEYVVGYK